MDQGWVAFQPGKLSSQDGSGLTCSLETANSPRRGQPLHMADPSSPQLQGPATQPGPVPPARLTAPEVSGQPLPANGPRQSRLALGPLLRAPQQPGKFCADSAGGVRAGIGRESLAGAAVRGPQGLWQLITRLPQHRSDQTQPSWGSPSIAPGEGGRVRGLRSTPQPANLPNTI